MPRITTARILADKALDEICGEECVRWAISMLEQGRSGRYLTRLATMPPPYCHGELAELRDWVLEELGILEPGRSVAVRRYAAERMQGALDGEEDILESLRAIKELCDAHEDLDELADLKQLYFACEELQHEEDQSYWPGATRENIRSIIREWTEALLDGVE